MKVKMTNCIICDAEMIKTHTLECVACYAKDLPVGLPKGR
jgi:hypothetical protein